MDETRKFIGSTQFRKRKFMYKFDELLEVLSGTNKSYRDLVLDENGKYSKKKTDALINELLKCLVEIRAYDGITENLTGGQMIYQKLTPKERSFYKSYFYLLLGIGMYNGGFYKMAETTGHEGGTWDAVLDIGCGIPEGLTMAEMDRYIINNVFCDFGEFLIFTDSFFIRMIWAYKYVTGRDFTEILTDDEFKAGYELLGEREKRWVDDPEYEDYVHKQELDEWNHLLDDFPEDDLPDEPLFDYSQEELDEIMEDSAMALGNTDDGQKISCWKVFFEDTERLESSCRTVHKGLCDPGVHGNLAAEIPKVIEYFISKKGYSAWMSDDKFFPIYTYLNKLVLASMKMLGED